MKFAIVAFGLLGACTYSLDTPAMNDLRERQRSLEAAQNTQAGELADLRARQSENDAKIRVMWQHGK
jgi:hypothetical protein